jgi:hypothetical protein
MRCPSPSRRCKILRPLLVLVLAVPLAAVAAGQDPGLVLPPPAHYSSGDAWLDGRLADIDSYAARYPEPFLAELERHAGVSRAYVRALLGRPGWQAGDVWMASFLARETGQDLRSLVRLRSRSQGRDWQSLLDERESGDALRLALRLALADSYRHWARPLQPDVTLERALRQRQVQQQQAPGTPADG